MANQFSLHALDSETMSKTPKMQVNLSFGRKYPGSSLQLKFFFFSNTVYFLRRLECLDSISYSHGAVMRMPTAQVYHPVLFFFSFTPQTKQVSLSKIFFTFFQNKLVTMLLVNFKARQDPPSHPVSIVFFLQSPGLYIFMLNGAGSLLDLLMQVNQKALA